MNLHILYKEKVRNNEKSKFYLTKRKMYQRQNG